SLTRQHLELAVAEPGGDMAYRGIFFTERDEHLDLFAVDLHETGPSGGDVHWRGAATGSSKASFEGLIQINPGAQQSHTYLQIHSMMLSPRAKVDASAQKPEVVLDAMDRFYRSSYSNVHRGVYTLAQEATDLFEGARGRIAAFVGGEAQTTVFTRNGTEALNMVAWSWGRDHVGRGD